MWECFRTWAEDWDYSNVDCVVIAILTHGLSGDLLLGVDGEPVCLDNLLWLFGGDRCSHTLAGKPKIFIIEGCRGKEEDHGVMDPTTMAPGNNYYFLPQKWQNIYIYCKPIVKVLLFMCFIGGEPIT